MSGGTQARPQVKGSDPAQAQHLGYDAQAATARCDGATVDKIEDKRGYERIREDKDETMQQATTGFTVWLTGLSGAGKTTIAGRLERELRARGRGVEVLDGDVVRTHLSKGLGFSREDRDTNILRIAFVAALLTRQGVAVISAAISPYEGARRQARELIGSFVEVYGRCSLDELIRRDVKGLYS